MNWMGLKEREVSTTAAPLAPLTVNPSLARRYQSFLQSIDQNSEINARWLELIERRIGYIHGQELAAARHINSREDDALAKGVSGQFSGAEQAILEVVEQVPFAHHQITDEQMTKLTVHLNPEAVVVVLAAAAFYDVNTRLVLFWRQNDAHGAKASHV